MTPEREAYVKKPLEIDKERYSQTLNIKINEFEPGKLEAETRVTEDHINTIGSAHGGFLFSFCDKAGGYCAGSTGHGRPYHYSQLSFLSAAGPSGRHPHLQGRRDPRRRNDSCSGCNCL